MMKNELELRKFVVPEMITGEGASMLLKRYLSHFSSQRPMIVTDKQVREQLWFSNIIESIQESVSEVIIFDDITPNPKDFEAMMGAEVFLSNDCDLVIAIGGGSPLDCAKCISIVSTNGGHILDYEGVDQINLPGPPLICIPSTSGTAADVSQFAIINDTQTNIKKAIISKKVVPDLALIDPIPLMTMDSYLTACTGMDALTHAIEAYVSNASSTLTNLHALESIRIVMEYLEHAVKPDRTLNTMYKMMMASTHAGMAFSNASLGAVHAMAHSMGGILDLPHGECNSILLEHVIEMNFQYASSQYTEIAYAMGIETKDMNETDVKEALMNRISMLRQNVGIPEYVEVKDMEKDSINKLVKASLSDPCMVTNPFTPNPKEVGDIFERIIKSKE